MGGQCTRGDDCLFAHDPAKKGLLARSHTEENLTEFYSQNLVSLLMLKDDPAALRAKLTTLKIYKRWDRGLPGGTPDPTTIIICTTLCAHRYISRVRSSQVLIFMY